MTSIFAAFRFICSVLAVVSVGLLAGLMLGTGMEQYTLRALPEAHWTLEHQTMDALFRRVMPSFFNVTAILVITASILAKGAARWMFGMAALLLVVSIAITVRIEVPMNRAVALWTPGAAPADWAMLRDRWLWNHLGRPRSSRSTRRGTAWKQRGFVGSLKDLFLD
jgi:uncharacterized membrane protein